MTGVLCCILCGKTAIDLPLDHGCRPNLPPEDLARVSPETWADPRAGMTGHPTQITAPTSADGSYIERCRGARPAFYDLFDQPKRTGSVVSASRPSGSPRARLDGLIRAVAEAPEGRRNATLYWACRRLVEMADEVPNVRAAWMQLADAAGQAGLGVDETAATIKSALEGQGVAL